jgi:hypothetical protein
VFLARVRARQSSPSKSEAGSRRPAKLTATPSRLLTKERGIRALADNATIAVDRRVMRPQGGKRARPGSPLRRKPAIRARTPTRHRRMPRRRMSGPIVTAAPPDKAIAVKGTHPGLKTSAKTKINADDRIAPSSDGTISQVLKRRSKATFPPQSPGESPVAPRLVPSELAASKHIYGAVAASHRICANRRACLRALAVSLGIRSGFWCPWSHCGPCLMARRLVEQAENFNPLCPVSDATDSAVTRLASVFFIPEPARY